MELDVDDISTAHLIHRYDKSVDEKIIMKFTRRAQTRTSCKKIARKKAGG